jgi:hypothetical protein
MASFTEDTVLLYGDLLFRTYILKNLLDWKAPLLAVVDSSPLDEVLGNTNDLAFCSAADDRAMYQQKVTLERVSSERVWQDKRHTAVGSACCGSRVKAVDRCWLRSQHFRQRRDLPA